GSTVSWCTCRFCGNVLSGLNLILIRGIFHLAELLQGGGLIPTGELSECALAASILLIAHLFTRNRHDPDCMKNLFDRCFLYCRITAAIWRSGRAAEGSGLENRRRATFREFESHLLRHIFF